MNTDELKDQAQKVVADATGAAMEATDRVRDLAKQTFTQENMAAAKDKALTAASNAKDFAQKTFTKDNVRAAGKIAKKEFGKLKTAEGREEAKRTAIAACLEGKRLIVEIWQGSRKGKYALIAVGIVLVLILGSCVFSSSDEVASGPAVAGGGGEIEHVIERCQYCFHERFRDKWETPPPCVKGRGHSYQDIGPQGNKLFVCEKCGKRYYLKYKPIGYKNCPCGLACNWREIQ